MFDLKNILNNFVNISGKKDDNILPVGSFGCVMARAGVGKTAFMVQTALGYLYKKENVLHISLNDPVDKICSRYRESFDELASSATEQEKDELWETMMPCRFIMTFNIDSFTVPKLEERLTDIIEQGIFKPQVVLIDGLDFSHNDIKKDLEALKIFAQKFSLSAWFSINTHRHENPPDGNVGLVPFSNVEDFFSLAVQLNTTKQDIHAEMIKGDLANNRKMLFDPKTMLFNSVDDK